MQLVYISSDNAFAITGNKAEFDKLYPGQAQEAVRSSLLILLETVILNVPSPIVDSPSRTWTVLKSYFSGSFMICDP